MRKDVRTSHGKLSWRNMIVKRMGEIADPGAFQNSRRHLHEHNTGIVIRQNASRKSVNIIEDRES